MEQKRMSHGMAIYNDNLYVIGGHSISNDYINSNEMFNGTAWVENGELKIARSHFSLVEVSSQFLPDDQAEECA